MIRARWIVGILGALLFLGGTLFGVLVQRIGAPVIWSLGLALGAYGVWLIVSALRLGESASE